MKSETKFRRPTTLVSYWLDGALHVENYLDRSINKATPDVIGLLDLFEAPATIEEVSDATGWPTDVVGTAVGDACNARLLVEVRPDDDELAADLLVARVWDPWPHDARYFHFATRDAPYLEVGSDEDAYVAAITSSDPPPLRKRYPNAPRVFLSRDLAAPPTPFIEVLRNRRTTRNFVDQNLEEAVLSGIMWHSFAPLKVLDGGTFGAVQIRPYAAAGARHEIECYIRISRVDEVEPGIYHYDPFEHALEWLAEDQGDAFFKTITYEQDFCGRAPFTIFTTAVLERMRWKYRHPRAYRALLLDAGHQAQVFAMVATVMGLGPFQTAAFRDDDVARLLDIDGITELPMYCMGAGPACAPEDDPDYCRLMDRDTWARTLL